MPTIENQIFNPIFKGVFSPVFGASLSPYAVAGFDPSLVFDFGENYYRTSGIASTFPSAITHSRASEATYTDSTGTLQTAAVNEPRIGHHVYNGSAWVNEGVLVESEARTNLLTYSEAINSSGGTSSWTLVNLTGTQDATIAPSGLQTADLLVATSNASNILYSPRAGGIALSAQNYTLSMFVKNNGADFLFVNIWSGGGTNGVGAWVNLQTGQIGSNQATTGYTFISATSVPMGNGWYRVSVTGTVPAANHYVEVIFTDADATFTYTSIAGTGAYIWGAQLEAGSTPSSYIPTAGATVTRASDILTVPAANLPWPSPVVIGEELVTNGTFNTDTDWIDSDGGTGTSVISGGVLTLTFSTLANPAARDQSFPTVAGKVYRFTCNLAGAQPNFARVDIGPTQGSSSISLKLGLSAEEFVFVATGTTTWVRLWHQNTIGSLTVDNVSVKEITPLALSIQMQGRQTGDSSTMSRWYLDANNYITQSSGTSDFTFSQAANGIVDSVTGGSFTSGVLQPFNFASTHASTLVAAAVDVVALTDNTTPTALPALSSTNMSLAYDFNGTIKLVRMWPENLTEAGREEASA